MRYFLFDAIFDESIVWLHFFFLYSLFLKFFKKIKINNYVIYQILKFKFLYLKIIYKIWVIKLNRKWHLISTNVQNTCQKKKKNVIQYVKKILFIFTFQIRGREVSTLKFSFQNINKCPLTQNSLIIWF